MLPAGVMKTVGTIVLVGDEPLVDSFGYDSNSHLA